MKLSLKLFTLVFIFLVTGCDVYDGGFDISEAIDKCEQSGGNCTEPTGANLLNLNISGSQPNVLRNSQYCDATNSTGNCVFDVAGLCNEADFASHFIEYRVYDQYTNLVHVPLTVEADICKRGKFRIQVAVPAGCVLTEKTLSIEIVGRDLTGTEHRNPLAAQKSVGLLFIKEGGTGSVPSC